MKYPIIFIALLFAWNLQAQDSHNPVPARPKQQINPSIKEKGHTPDQFLPEEKLLQREKQLRKERETEIRAQIQKEMKAAKRAEDNPAVSADPQDSLVLVALYNATNGNNWKNNSGWLQDSVYKWNGITIDSNGKVVSIHLNYNYLTGTIPPKLGNLSNLIKLYLYSNQLSGNIPTELANLSNLKELVLYSNQLSGNIPPELSNLSNLQFLDLSSNQLSGNIPPELGNLANLQWLYLSSNKLSGNIPKEFGNLSNLKWLELYSNTLSGSIPPELGNLANLQWLYLSSNTLSGSIPPELGNLVNLAGLYLSFNQLSGNIPPELGNLSNLTGLDLYSNQLSGNIPTELGNLANLQFLDLSHNQLSGNILSELCNSSNLQWFHLSSNQLSGNIPTELDNLANLQNLDLSHNQLSGNIPTEFGNLANLQTLSLSSNQLSGNIPTELGNLSNLQNLDLSHNRLSGNIPTVFGNLSNLQRLYLSSNQLSGNIPPKLGNLSNLQRLYLSSNQLSGNIPTEFGYLSNLQLLDLSINQLSEMPNLPVNLCYDLYIYYNQLTFEDIEPNIHVAKYSFQYSPQAKVGEPVDTALQSEDLYQMQVSVGGEHNRYQWFFNGDTITGATDSTLTIHYFSADSAGNYVCKITNTVVTDLTLESEPINLHLGYGVTFHVVDNSGVNIENTRIVLKEDTLYSDTDGHANIVLTPGKYGYKISKEGYETLSDSLTVGDEDITLTLILNIATGMEGLSSSAIKVYPNPSSGRFVIEATDPFVGAQLRLIDLKGNIIMLKNLNKEKRTEIDLTGWAKGIYILQIRNKKHLFQRQIVVK